MSTRHGGRDTVRGVDNRCARLVCASPRAGSSTHGFSGGGAGAAHAVPPVPPQSLLSPVRRFREPPPPAETPARVFARIKNRVQRERDLDRTYDLDYSEASVMILSPGASPQKTAPHPSSLERPFYTPRKRCTEEASGAPLQKATPSKYHQQQNTRVERSRNPPPSPRAHVYQEKPPLKSPAKMFDHIKERVRQRHEVQRVHSSRKQLRNTESPGDLSDGADVALPAGRQHLFPSYGPTRVNTTTMELSSGEAHVILENVPLMSPAKMFAHMRERERTRKRELLNGVGESLSKFLHADEIKDGDSTEGLSLSEYLLSSDHSEPHMFRVNAADGQSESDPSSVDSPPAIKRRGVSAKDPVRRDFKGTSILKTQAYDSMETLKSPAKTFAHMTDRERQGQHHAVNTTMELSNGEAHVYLERLSLESPVKMFAHMRERELKRKRELLNGVLSADEIKDGDSTEGRGLSKYFLSSDQSEPHSGEGQSESDPSDVDSPPLVKRRVVLAEDPVRRDFKATSFLKSQAYDSVETLKSPAKTFANIKERSRQGHEVQRVRSSRKQLRNTEPSGDLSDGADVSPPAGKQHLFSSEDPMLHYSLLPSKSKRQPKGRLHDRPIATNWVGIEGCAQLDAFAESPERTFSISQFRLGGESESPPASHPNHGVAFPAFRLESRTLVEDPLVINSPQFLITKRRKPVVVGNAEPPKAAHEQEPKVTGIKLIRWTLMSNNRGLYVDGLRMENNIQWHSNIITERVSKSVLKTHSGNTYNLIGKMHVEKNSKLPKWFLKKFLYGFPKNWTMQYNKFVLQSKTEAESRGKTSDTVVTAKPSAKVPAKQQKQMPLKTSSSGAPSCPNSTLLGMNVSRSGRVIKPPLEYWKGGRVVLDASMNITIHESYDIVSKPQTVTHVTRRAGKFAKKPTALIQPSLEGQNPGELTNGKSESPGLCRKGKAAQRTRNRAKADTSEPATPVKFPEKFPTGADVDSTGDQATGRRAPRGQSLVPEATQVRDVAKCPEPPHHQTRQSKRPAARNSRREAATSTESVIQRKPNTRKPKLPATVASKSLQSDDEFPRTRKKVQRAKAQTTQSSRLSPSSPPPDSVVDPDRGSRRSKPKSKGIKETAATPKPAPPRPEQNQKKTNKTTQQDVVKENEWAKGEVERLNGSEPGSKGTKPDTTPKPAPPRGEPSTKSKKGRNKTRTAQQDVDKENEWAQGEVERLKEAVTSIPKHVACFWATVALAVGTRSAEECQKQYMFQGSCQASHKKPKKSKKSEPPKQQELPKITAKAGTLKRKEQVRQYMETMPKDDHDDFFSSVPMQNRVFTLPSMSCSEDEPNFTFLEPLSPGAAPFPVAKTPPCLHLTPGMFGSINRKKDDRYVYKIQKRMKKSQVSDFKHTAPSKNLTYTPTMKKMMRCGNTENDSFVVRKMFPDNDGADAESGEEEDFYFSDKD